MQSICRNVEGRLYEPLDRKHMPREGEDKLTSNRIIKVVNVAEAVEPPSGTASFCPAGKCSSASRIGESGRGRKPPTDATPKP